MAVFISSIHSAIRLLFLIYWTKPGNNYHPKMPNSWAQILPDSRVVTSVWNVPVPCSHRGPQCHCKVPKYSTVHTKQKHSTSHAGGSIQRVQHSSSISHVWARQVASLGGGQQMCPHLPPIRAQAGSFALYFHEPSAVTAPGASADGGQHTAKGCQAQAAPRGFHSVLYRNQEARPRWEGGNRHPAWLTLSLHLPERRASPSAALMAHLPPQQAHSLKSQKIQIVFCYFTWTKGCWLVWITQAMHQQPL